MAVWGLDGHDEGALEVMGIQESGSHDTASMTGQVAGLGLGKARNDRRMAFWLIVESGCLPVHVRKVGEICSSWEIRLRRKEYTH